MTPSLRETFTEVEIPVLIWFESGSVYTERKCLCTYCKEMAEQQSQEMPGRSTGGDNLWCHNWCHSFWLRTYMHHSAYWILCACIHPVAIWAFSISTNLPRLERTPSSTDISTHEGNSDIHSLLSPIHLTS